MFIQDSKDILNLVIAFSVLWVAIFLSWLLYYAAQILKHANQIIEEVQHRIHELTESVGHIRDKLELVGAGVGYVMDGLKHITGKLGGSLEHELEDMAHSGVKFAKKKVSSVFKRSSR